MELTKDFREKVREAILLARENFTGSDAKFAKSIGLGSSIFSRLKNGETERIAGNSFWLQQAREQNVALKGNNWKPANTSVMKEIRESINFCKDFSKSMMLVDECGIGKTFCARYVVRELKDAFYVDCSQAKTRIQFIRLLARTVGIDHNGRYVDVKENLKYYINMMQNPVIVLDEAGDLDYQTFMMLKEMWNATEGRCGWYMMGADGLRSKIEKGINSKKVGYREIFSRYSDEFIKVVPTGIKDRQVFYTQLVGDVAGVNLGDKSIINKLVQKCVSKDKSLRHLETLIQLNTPNEQSHDN